ncbi:hypothetical protein Btru_052742 [Bulinus truncatus]|nr:hypothetical protein Btru_052742 [Bulinus truncatus]
MMESRLNALVLTLHFLGHSGGYIIGDKLLDVAYKDLGDLNVGGLFAISMFNNEGVCGGKVSRDIFPQLHAMEILAYTVRKINANESLLPRIKLGYVFLDFCSNVQAAMIQAKRFLPRSNPMDYIPTNETNYLTSYKVIGLIGGSVTHVTVPISVLFGGAGIPILSYMDGLDEFSDKKLHPTFLRLSSPTWLVFEAMVHFMKGKDWKFFSLVLEEKTRDYQMELRFRQLASAIGICLHDIFYVTVAADFAYMVNVLVKGQSRVVVAFVSMSCAHLILSTLQEMNAEKKMILLLTDSWIERRLPQGAIVFTSSDLDLEEFKIDERSLQANPWFRKLMAQTKCDDAFCRGTMAQEIFTSHSLNKGNIHDAMMTYAIGLHQLLYDKCPASIGAQAASCFDSNSGEFTQYLKNLNFKGYSENVAFKSTGDKVNQINVYQMVDSSQGNKVTSRLTKVAMYSTLFGTLAVYRNVSLGWVEFPMNETLIETKCRTTCSANEYFKMRQCCWVCKRCQVNERVISDNGGGCSQCPPLQWPAMGGDDKLSVCEMIEPSFYSWRQSVAMAMLVVNGSSILLSLIVMLFLWLKNDAKERDSPMWLVVLQLLATVWGFISVPIFLERPNDFNCNAAHTLFILSFSIQYKALFLRSLHVYRSGTMMNESELMVSTRCMTIGVILMAMLEVMVFLVIYLMYPVTAAKTHPNRSVNVVELVCTFPIAHQAVFFLFSILMLLLSSIFALRSQADFVGFEQSRFVPTYVLIALTGWIVFMPAYYIAEHPRVRMLLRILIVLFNHNASLLLTYTPRFMMLLLVKKRKESMDHASASRKMDALREKMAAEEVDHAHTPQPVRNMMVFKMDTPKTSPPIMAFQEEDGSTAV